MEKFGRTGNLLLGYGTFGNDPSSSRQPAAEKNSDDSVDFNDVFGGPPKRFSMHETRYNFGGGRIEFESESRRLWPGSGEKPVFGESYGPARRHTSEDFYDDIFKSSDDSHGSPRWSCPTPTPGSRMLSPVHPRIEPLAASLPPAQFSLPAKSTEAIDLPTFGSSSSSRSPYRYKEGTSNVHTPNTSLSKFSSQAMQEHDDLTNTPQPSPGQTLLSHESSFTGSTENENGGNSKQNTARTVTPSSEFHFSIHKWAGRGVPLLISLRGGKNPTLKECSKVSPLSTANVQDADFVNEDSSANRGIMKTNSGNGLSEGIEKELSMAKQEVNEQWVKPLRDEVEGQGDEEISRKAEGKENTEKMTGLSNSNVGATGKIERVGKKMSSNKKAEVNKSAVLSPKISGENLGKSRVKGKVRDFVKIFNQEGSPKTKMNAVAQSLSSRWSSYKSDNEISDPTSALDSKLLAADVKTMSHASSTTEFGSEVPVDNVKMMSDASSTTESGSTVPLDNVKMMSDASRTTELGHNVRAKNVKTRSDASSTTELGSKVPADNVKMKLDAPSTTKLDSKVPTDKVKIMPDASFVAEERIDKQQVGWNRTIRKVSDVCFAQMDASPSSGAVPYGSKDTAENIDEPFLENFQIEELPPVEDKFSKTQEDSEAIRASESKIRQWSNGRKGNIRSLLSTLQYVLWPESGWKPVALVDIIEANAVKKAYNRAMLCLHPDKLQQKGAASHQKYLAEKVFDILQEAWDHFNSLGTLI